ncbi:hypothetical protein [Catelliglobosispora koreensis]|uniref:hypothetical protein n=1 Tax=Catelliglobosispora koreensis TaxID=129052 RepID=UPI00035D449C|nr:hypothetical protein [Catelliglobosispora koreensis]
MAVFGKERRCVEEVASVYAEQFHQLGYLPVDRLLNEAEWDLLNGDLRKQFDGHDVRRSEAEHLFGPPSLIIGKRIPCYATPSSPGWIFFDCFTEAATRYIEGGQRRKSCHEGPFGTARTDGRDRTVTV